MEGCCKAKITINESPSIEKLLSFKVTVSEVAKSVAKASPKLGSQGGLIWEIALIMWPL
jgi:hypothetical protein